MFVWFIFDKPSLLDSFCHTVEHFFFFLRNWFKKHDFSEKIFDIKTFVWFLWICRTCLSKVLTNLLKNVWRNFRKLPRKVRKRSKACIFRNVSRNDPLESFNTALTNLPEMFWQKADFFSLNVWICNKLWKYRRKSFSLKWPHGHFDCSFNNAVEKLFPGDQKFHLIVHKVYCNILFSKKKLFIREAFVRTCLMRFWQPFRNFFAVG